jgi:hypothetical protein
MRAVKLEHCRLLLSVARSLGLGLLQALFVVCALAAGGKARAANAPGENLAAEFTDPLTPLPQILVQDAYTPSNFGTDLKTNGAILRLIIPRVPRFSLFPFDQVIRPSFSIVTVPSGAEKGTRTELGDMQLFDLAIMPWPSEQTGIKLGLGPTLVFPTATSKLAGSRAWQSGPAGAVAYLGTPGLLAGFLALNPISFEYTSPHATPQSTLEFQPVLLYQFWRGWYVKSADSTWSLGWRHGTPTMLPLSIGMGRAPSAARLAINLYVSGECMLYRQFAPIAPQATVRFGMTLDLPWLKRW